MKNTIAEQIDMLRAQIEMALPTPLLLVVSSAQTGDGSAFVCAEIARSMSGAGHATLLVLADDGIAATGSFNAPLPSIADVIARTFAAYIAHDPRLDADVLKLTAGGNAKSASRADVAQFSAACRSSYAVTIINAQLMLSNAFALLAAATSDGLIVSTKHGRRVTAADRRLSSMLKAESIPVLGVVSLADNLADSPSAGVPHIVAKDAASRLKVGTSPASMRESPSTS